MTHSIIAAFPVKSANCPNYQQTRSGASIGVQLALQLSHQSCDANITVHVQGEQGSTAGVCSYLVHHTRSSPAGAARYAGAGSSSTSASSYLDLQCSSGYEGRLCSICQTGYGSSGSLLGRQ